VENAKDSGNKWDDDTADALRAAHSHFEDRLQNQFCLISQSCCVTPCEAHSFIGFRQRKMIER
jgi:hypothetical protein